MKILIVGSGGREHAIGLQVLKSSKVSKLYFASGNGGTANIGENISASSPSELLKFALENKIDLTIVGSEALLVEGIVDVFQDKGLKILGPDKKAALLEGSKQFAKDFMKKYEVKTAKYENFTDYQKAIDYLKDQEFPIVIKADGLAAGKGVVIVQSFDEGKQTIEEMMLNSKFGSAGNQIVIEEFLDGVEVSVLSLFNGKEIYPLLSAKDHKKIGEGETGLNTGGMGVVCPNPYYIEEVEESFLSDILNPTLKGLKEENLLFSGVIFFGLMICKGNVYLLEYNLRFGDPETQAVLPLLETDFLEIIEKTIEGKEIKISWKKAHSCCVVMASGGYPESYEKGFSINGLDSLICSYYIAGAKKEAEKFITSGGRVLNVVGIGESLEQANEIAYSEIQKVSFSKAYYRKDIGK